ncbi:MAG: hypothetical protein ACRDSP_05240 [Pseudonocardiaceae bacterium]
MRTLNEVETFARVGERVGERTGAALGIGVRTARKGARKGAEVARENATWASKELVRRMPDHTAKLTENARRAGYAAQAALAERAGQAQDVVAEHWGPALDALAERWGVTQDVLAERLLEARHELAARIEPEPPSHRRRWPWLVLLLFAVAGIAGAVVLTRRPREIEPDTFFDPSPREPGSRDSDPDPGGGSVAGNGVVGAERPTAGTD